MRCERARELLSELMDGGAPQARAHVETCAACARELELARGARAALRRAGPTPTTPELSRAVLAAVDAAAREDARAPAEAHRRAAALAAAAFARRSRLRLAGSHAAALLAGAALVLAWLALRAAPQEPAPGPVARNVRPPAPQVVERTVPVPVYWPLTRVVVREREVVREVERPVVRERVVRRGPLVALDVRPLAEGLAEGLARAGSELARAERERAAAPPREVVAARTAPAEPEEPDRATRRVPPSAAAVEPPERPGRPGANAVSVSLRRVGDRVVLETRGAVAELVPVLIARLEEDDGEVARVVERRLAEIRSAAQADPALAPRLRQAAAEPDDGGLARWLRRGEPESDAAVAAPEGADGWRRWWAANGALLASAGGSASP